MKKSLLSNKIPYLFFHVSNLGEAIRIQEKLRKKIVLANKNLKIKKLAAVDSAYLGNKIISAVIVFSYPELKIIEAKFSSRLISFPYIPGFLSFREAPTILSALKKLKNFPDVILFDGQGIAHPRNMGVATHIGIVLDSPTIGIAKKPLLRNFDIPENRKGSYTFIYQDNRLIGFVLRSRTNVKPIFISPGHKISPSQSLKIVQHCLGPYRLPEPIREVHHFVQGIKFKAT